MSSLGIDRCILLLEHLGVLVMMILWAWVCRVSAWSAGFGVISAGPGGGSELEVAGQIW